MVQRLEAGSGKILHQTRLVPRLPQHSDRQLLLQDLDPLLLVSQHSGRPDLEVQVQRGEDLVKLRVEVGLALARLLARLANRHSASQDLGSQHLDKLRSHLPPLGNRHNLRRHLASLRSQRPPLDNPRNRHPVSANLHSHPLVLVSLLNLHLDLDNLHLGHQGSVKMRPRTRSPQHPQLAASANHLSPIRHLDSLHSLLQRSPSRTNPHPPLDNPASLLPALDNPANRLPPSVSQVSLPLRLGSLARLLHSGSLRRLESRLALDKRRSGLRLSVSQHQQTHSIGRSEKLSPRRRTWTQQHRRPHDPSLEQTLSEIP